MSASPRARQAALLALRSPLPDDDGAPSVALPAFARFRGLDERTRADLDVVVRAVLPALGHPPAYRLTRAVRVPVWRRALLEHCLRIVQLHRLDGTRR